MNYSKEQQVEYLEALGYTIEDCVVTQHHDETRSSEAYKTDHPITIAYVGAKPNLYEVKPWYVESFPHHIANVFNEEFYGRLYNAMLIQAKQSTLKQNFQ